MSLTINRIHHIMQRPPLTFILFAQRFTESMMHAQCIKQEIIRIMHFDRCAMCLQQRMLAVPVGYLHIQQI